MGRIGEKNKTNETEFLEVQPNVLVRYKVYRHLKPFHKAAKKKLSTQQTTTTTKVHRYHSSNQQFNDDDPPKRSVNSPAKTKEKREIPAPQPDPEGELDVDDGMEELPRNTVVETVPPVNKNPNIIFVLLHGLLYSTASWDKIVYSLRQYGTVLSFDRWI